VLLKKTVAPGNGFWYNALSMKKTGYWKAAVSEGWEDSIMAKEFKLTQESLDKLKDELEYLKTVREQEVAEQIKEARSFGDLSENSEYDEAKNEQGKVYSRIAELENIVAHAVIISDDQYAADEVSPGCRFIVEDMELGETEEYHFVGSQEANPMEGKISDESPFGKAMLGKKVGTVVDVEAPVGIVKYKIVDVKK